MNRYIPIFTFLAVVLLVVLVVYIADAASKSRLEGWLVTKKEVEALDKFCLKNGLSVPGFEPSWYSYHYEPPIDRPTPPPNKDTQVFLNHITDKVNKLRQQQAERPNRVTTLRLKSLCHIYDHFAGTGW